MNITETVWFHELGKQKTNELAHYFETLVPHRCKSFLNWFSLQYLSTNWKSKTTAYIYHCWSLPNASSLKQNLLRQTSSKISAESIAKLQNHAKKVRRVTVRITNTKCQQCRINLRTGPGQWSSNWASDGLHHKGPTLCSNFSRSKHTTVLLEECNNIYLNF